LKLGPFHTMDAPGQKSCRKCKRIGGVFRDAAGRATLSCAKCRDDVARDRKRRAAGLPPTGGRAALGAARRLPIAECDAAAAAHGGVCLEVAYLGRTARMRWRCAARHEWAARFDDAATWCPGCAGGRSEACARAVFEETLGVEFVRVRPPWLERLELDGYSEALKLAFEYNGAQHDKFSPFFHKSEEVFAAQKARDARKLALCAARGVRVVVIPSGLTAATPARMRAFVTAELAKLGVNFSK
jgi:hypothetical protein